MKKLTQKLTPVYRSVFVCVILLCLGWVGVVAYEENRTAPIKAEGTIQVAFPPWDNAEGLIVDVIHDAKEYILVQAYILTNKTITKALVAAKQRGVRVEVLLDGNQYLKLPKNQVKELVAANVPIWLEMKYQNAHNKIMLVDAESTNSVVVTGSFNFTWSAQYKNSENVLVMYRNKPIAMRYLQNWQRHQKEAFLLQ
jgi:phosphatidylserine/phosphatidylglycerophosphate/cardiolipin synthase-like enzyme